MKTDTRAAERKISRNVLLLSLTSLLNDLSAELVMAVLPLFIALLGGGGLGVGLIGGVEGSTKSILSIFAGHWSDRLRRKPLVFGGYLIAVLARLGLPFTALWGQVLGLRLLDRVGKGLRTAPRDALIADSTETGHRGLGFGFHRAMDSAGAILGSVLAFLLYTFAGLGLRPLLLLGGALGGLALLPLLGVREVMREPSQPRPLLLGLRGLSRPFKLNLAAMTLFAFANLSYMFFLLRVSQHYAESRAEFALPLALYVIFNLVYTAFSVPAGALSDRLGRRAVLLVGYLLFVPVSCGFILARSLPGFAALFALYGLVYALIEGNQRAWAADLAAREERGLALGVFHLSIGLAALVGNALAGLLWQALSPEAAFLFAAAGAGAAAVLLVIAPRFTQP